LNLGNIFFKLIFILLALLSAYYISFIKTEKYQSKSVIMIKDLSQEQSVSAFGSLLLPTGSKSVQDAKLLELYIKSSGMFKLIDNDFNLTQYYTSNKIDTLNRLSMDAILPIWELNRKNLITRYSNDLTVLYDEASKTIEIGFAHADATVAKKIVENIIKYAGKKLNFFEKKNSEVILTSLKEQEKEKYERFLASVKRLLDYQNRHNTINPQSDVESKAVILSSLEGELVQKEVEYNSKLQYMNAKTAEMKLLKSNIRYIKQSIQNIKKEITGSKGKKELNVDVSEFQLLQGEVEFNKEMYKQTLAKLEETTILVNQNRKNLIVITPAGVSDSYIYPNKLKDTLSILIILSFIYGITTLILTIIRDHKD